MPSSARCVTVFDICFRSRDMSFQSLENPTEKKCNKKNDIIVLILSSEGLNRECCHGNKKLIF